MQKLLLATLTAGLAHSAVFAAESAPPGSAGGPPACPVAETAKPNIIYILADDLGYGDVQCLNPKRGKIPTPNLDKLAAQGMTFTDAHSDATVCAPSRYALLTGRHHWRARLQWAPEFGAPMIPAERLTLPGMLRQNGYATACFGKWHLGNNWPKKNGAIDYTRPIADGPTARGFDTYFGVDAPNWPPFCFIENDRTVGIPSVPMPADTYDYYRLTSRHGLSVPGWKLEEILPTVTGKACDYIAAQAKADKPFFLYLPLTSPHTPLSPSKEWAGKSTVGVYGDFVMETDAMVGRVLDTLEKNGLTNKTLVVFSSDNGACSHTGVKTFGKGGAAELEALGHFPSANFRGYKGAIFEGGHREPFFVRWPGIVKPGTTCDKLVGQVDLMATCAEITGAKVPATAAEDSFSLLPLLKGGDKPVRENLVNHAFGQFALREGQWKLIPGKTPCLYDLAADIGETKNVAAQHPEIVKRLTTKLKQIVAAGRATPGPKQKNDLPVKIIK